MNKNKKYILSVHHGHDSSCTLICNGKIIASAAEERFTQDKHYCFFPTRSIQFCLKSSEITIDDIDLFVIPGMSTRKEIDTYFNLKTQGLIPKPDEGAKMDFNYILRHLLIYASRVLRFSIKYELPSYIKGLDMSNKKLLLIDHHLAHAASAYYGSGFKEKTLIVTSDGSGDGLSTTVWVGEGGKMTSLLKIGREGSLGAFYGTVTESLGWQVSDGEGKVMGLAPYGNTKKTKGKLEFICPHYENGKLVRPYDWGFPGQWEDQGTVHWHYQMTDKVLKLVQKYGKEDIAAEAQRLLEREILAIVRYWQKKTNAKYLALSGGVFLNVKVNQRIIESKFFDDVFVYPDAGDSGLTAGGALYGYFYSESKEEPERIDSLYWGPEWNDDDIIKILKTRKIKYKKLSEQQIPKIVSELLAKGKIIGWFQGKMEAGPRALGNRSILMDPRKAENKDIINSTVKYREAFRPFCPSVIEEAAPIFFEKCIKAPFMIVSYDVKKDKRKIIPAVTHVDGTARPQTVTRIQNKRYYELIKTFGEKTGVPVLLNTSFNIRGEPIVCSPEDAIKCFYDTGIEYLMLGNFLIQK